jgi:hypothetical protein
MIARLGENGDDASEFTERLQRLRTLSERRDALLQKVRLYGTVHTQLGPLQTPQTSIQPSLVGREGPLVDELATAKNRGIRLTGRVARLKHSRPKTARYKSPTARPVVPGRHDQSAIVHEELVRRH